MSTEASLHCKEAGAQIEPEAIEIGENVRLRGNTLRTSRYSLSQGQ